MESLENKLKNKIESRESPSCQRCGKNMEKATGYYLGQRDIVRIDVPYFFCNEDRTAQLDEQALDRELALKKVQDKKRAVQDIKEWVRKELHFWL